jgi:hypothetical protein
MATIGLVGFQVDLSALKKQSHQRGIDVKVAGFVQQQLYFPLLLAGKVAGFVKDRRRQKKSRRVCKDAANT